MASRAVDVMVAVGPNMFYTVTLPCTLWFFDKSKSCSSRRESAHTSGGKGKDQSGLTSAATSMGGGTSARTDSVLFIDARHIYRQVDRAHREWTPAQIGFLANLVRLYRGEAPDYTLGGDEARAKIEEIFGEAADSKTPRSALRVSRMFPVCAAPPL